MSGTSLPRIAAHERHDVTHHVAPLHDRVVGKELNVAARSATARHRFRNHLDRTHEILHTELRPRDRIRRLDHVHRRVRPRVRVVQAEAVDGIAVDLGKPVLELRALIDRGGRARNRRVGHANPELVGRPNALEQQLRRHTVFRLRDVVEPRIVHQARRESHAPNPIWRAHRLHRVHILSKAPIAQSEHVPNFVRRDHLHDLAAELIVKRPFARTWIYRRSTKEVARGEVHVAVLVIGIPRTRAFVHLQVLSRARIENPTCLRQRTPDARLASAPQQHRVTHVFERPLGIVRRVACDDGVAEPCGLEGRLPRFDRAAHVWAPFRRRCAVYIDHDGHDGIADRPLRMLFLQAPPQHHFRLIWRRLRATRPEARKHLRRTSIPLPGHHGSLWQTHEVPVSQLKHRLAAPRYIRSCSHNDVLGKATRPVDSGRNAVGRRFTVEPLPNRAREQRRDIDHGRTIATFEQDRKCARGLPFPGEISVIERRPVGIREQSGLTHIQDDSVRASLPTDQLSPHFAHVSVSFFALEAPFDREELDIDHGAGQLEVQTFTESIRRPQANAFDVGLLAEIRMTLEWRCMNLMAECGQARDRDKRQSALGQRTRSRCGWMCVAIRPLKDRCHSSCLNSRATECDGCP